MKRPTKDQLPPDPRSYTCVFCKCVFPGWGNNPEPVVAYESGRACDACNDSVVIPARLARIFGEDH